jgi:hypothetical protein
MRCNQCGKSNGTVQEAWICDPGGQPIQAWLHRDCEAAFLQQLEPNWDFIIADLRQRGLIPARVSRDQAIKALKASISVANAAKDAA